MRDPARLNKITNFILMYWAAYPDWRFMQLMENFRSWYGADPFYMDDDEFIKKFRDFMKIKCGIVITAD